MIRNSKVTAAELHLFQFLPAFSNSQKQKYDKPRQQKTDWPFGQRCQSGAGIHHVIILFLRRTVAQIKEKQDRAEKENKIASVMTDLLIRKNSTDVKSTKPL